MSGHRKFTAEQIALLKINQNTRSISETRIEFTPEFQEKASEMMRSGYGITAILALHDYDTEILGKDRIRGLGRKLRRESPSGACGGESGSGTGTGAVSDERLRAENVMLRQQLDFLKKIISARTGQESGE